MSSDFPQGLLEMLYLLGERGSFPLTTQLLRVQPKDQPEYGTSDYFCRLISIIKEITGKIKRRSSEILRMTSLKGEHKNLKMSGLLAGASGPTQN